MKSDKNKGEFGFIDNDTPESLKLDLPPEEIDRLYEETFGNECNEKNPKDKMDLPTIRVIITDDDYALKRKDGIYIIPLAALKN